MKNAIKKTTLTVLGLLSLTGCQSNNVISSYFHAGFSISSADLELIFTPKLMQGTMSPEELAAIKATVRNCFYCHSLNNGDATIIQFQSRMAMLDYIKRYDSYPSQKAAGHIIHNYFLYNYSASADTFFK